MDTADDALPNFSLVNASTVDDVLKARAENTDSKLVGGGTDLVVNIRRGIVAPPVLIDVTHVKELRAIKADTSSLEIGASVTLAELAEDPDVLRHYPVVGGGRRVDRRARPTATWARSAATSASTRAASITIRATGGAARSTTASRPPARSATSRPRAAACASRPSRAISRRALLTLGAEIDIAGPAGRRTLPARQALHRLARQDQPVTETLGDGKYFRSRAGEFVTAVRAGNTPALRSGYDKIRIRRSIEYPVCGVARRCDATATRSADLRVAFTGTNPRPVLLDGTDRLCGGALDARVFKGLDDLVRDQSWR
jgi:4-hydroxybenzoyl-CoA reductase subunit beta